MKKDMNLLPWRIKQLRQKNRRLLVTLFIGATLYTISTLLLTHFAQGYTDNAGKAQLQYTTHQQELQATQQQIQQFRHSHAQLETLQEIPKEILFSLLNQLDEFPLTQGELTELHLNSEHLMLKGYAENQEEFSRLNGYLSAQPLFREVNLVEFKPQAQELRFQFDVKIKTTP
ncbi:competence protein ComB [Aggregatibacter sp. oral taxon 513]|uniref:PilN domain-containing protein n=1 Tax=Aggregatibacter sp. oral taxon 513 TaxID=712150 RepID=UPI001BA711B3|nr:PilN domain-containing protein [Aggregatibacter sp. oral taxon 513]QUC06093.1 competence protein ComB [Aggregatibacter sp. oral taxon 513]